MGKSIIIIGSGVGGLATGIFGQQNGFTTRIFEAHSLTGGQCTSWTRKGYVFDGCLHHFGGGFAGSKLEGFWKEVGVQPCENVDFDELISFHFPDGTTIHNYCDVDKFEKHLVQYAPEDTRVIREFIDGIKLLRSGDTIGSLMFGSWKERVSVLPLVLKMIKYFKYTLDSYSLKFKNPALRRAISALHYSIPEFPLFGQLLKQANVAAGGVSWPVGGATTISTRMALRYQQLGGLIQCGKSVKRILTNNGKAHGVELEDGTQHNADFIVSNADGRKTIMNMLSGRYTNKKVLKYCEPHRDTDREFAVLVFLGVERDLSSYPPASVIFLDEPVTICGLICQHLDIQIYGYDSTMAPQGKGVIKVGLRARPSYFSSLRNDIDAYNVEKARVADQVIDLLERIWPGTRVHIDVIDVVTLNTWERYMGGTTGWHNWPNKKFSILSDIFGFGDRYTLQGLKNFYFTGQWVTSAGALLLNAISGKTVIKKICKQCGTHFS